MTNWIYFFFVVQLFHFVGTWRLYQLAGRKAWEAAIPVYNAIVLLKIIQRPQWWAVILFIPIVAPIMFMVIWVDLARCFGKRTAFEGAISVLTLGGYLAYLNYFERPKYTGPEIRKETVLSSLAYAVVFATVVHTFVIRPFIIPTGSMERTLRIGDMLFVEYSKYGLRLPITPIGIPFLSGTLKRAQSADENNIKSYLDFARLPYFRLPGWGKVERDDIVVFNFPLDSLHTAIDRKDPYVKRCVGIPGDVLEIKEGKVLINGTVNEFPEDARIQYPYSFNVNDAFDKSFLLENYDLVYGLDYIYHGNKKYIFYNLDESLESEISGFNNVTSFKKEIERNALFYPSKKFVNSSIDLRIVFPYNSGNTEFNFKPIKIPQKGATIKLNSENINTYLDIITRYENNKFEYINDGDYLINGVVKDEYTFKQNYYFMMGDNRGNSLDSRFWGFVPEDHIVGRPIMIWASFEGVFNRSGAGFKPRWERFMTIPNNGKANKTSYLFLVVAMIVGYVGYSLWKSRKN